MGSLFRPTSTVVQAPSQGTVQYEIPQYFKDLQENVFARANVASQQPFQAFEGERIADLTALQNAAITQAATNLGQFGQSGVIPEAQERVRAAANIAGTQFTTDIANQYMNPFIDTVANNAIRNLQEESARAQQTARAQAVSRGAFGGARQGIQEATLQAETAKRAGDLTAQLQAQAFQDAANRFASDRAVAAQGQLTAAQAVPGLQAQLGQTGLREAAAATQFGGLQQAVRQQQLLEDYRDFVEQQGFERGQLGFLSSILTGAPIRSYGEERSGTVGQVIGGTSPFGQIAGAIGSAYMMSDSRLKEDIELVGKSPLGINIYEFKYINNPDRYQGVIAQEVPEASINVNGFLAVDYNKIDVDFKKLR